MHKCSTNLFAVFGFNKEGNPVFFLFQTLLSLRIRRIDLRYFSFVLEKKYYFSFILLILMTESLGDSGWYSKMSNVMLGQVVAAAAASSFFS